MKKLDATIERFVQNAEYERTHGSLQGCMDFKQLAEWLKDYKRLLEQEPKTGEWILQPSNKEQGERDFIWWKCSECGQVIYSETKKDRREYHAFCSRCGAIMQ